MRSNRLLLAVLVVLCLTAVGILMLVPSNLLDSGLVYRGF